MVVGCSEICSLTVKIFPLSQQDLREPDLCAWVFVWMLGLAPKPPRTKAPAVQQVFKRQATALVTRLGFWYVDSDLQIVSAGLKAAQKELTSPPRSARCSLQLAASLALPLRWINPGSSAPRTSPAEKRSCCWICCESRPEPAVMRSRTNPLPLGRRRVEVQTGTSGGRRRLQPAQAAEGLLLLLKLLFVTVANCVNKVPCISTHMHCSVMSQLFKGNNSHKLCPVFKATVVLVFKTVARDLPLSIK